MQFPTAALTQSRLSSWIVTTCVLALPSFFLNPTFVCADESLGVLNDGFSQLGLADPAGEDFVQAEAASLDMEENDGYAPDFAYLDRGLIGRQAPDMNKLTNNQKMEMDISPGTTIYFVFPQGQSSSKRAEQTSQEALDAPGTEKTSANPADEGIPSEDSARVENADTEDATIELIRRQATQSIYITSTTCSQPTPPNNASLSSSTLNQLVMYVSTSSQNQRPGPNTTDPNSDSSIIPNPFDHGYAWDQVSTGSDVYIGISAPNLSDGWSGNWHFELAVSTDDFYHQYDGSTTYLFMVDTDSSATLFVTQNISLSDDPSVVEQYKQQNPFQMYAFPNDTWTPITGMEHSYCALKSLGNSSSTSGNSASGSNNFTITTNITTKFGNTDFPKSQYLLDGLDAGKTYKGVLVVNQNQQTGNSDGVGPVGAGGLVFLPFNWTTKPDDTCQLITDLDFCDSVAYSVPSATRFKNNMTGLKDLYDNLAQAYYTNFSNSLAQVACNTVPESQYSLAVNCSLCAKSYKDWLCSVLIPRCESFSNLATHLQPRNINAPFPNGTFTYDGNVTAAFNASYRNRWAYNQSRNPMIDTVIAPGPYKEVKPCDYLCYDIVRTCPALMQFQCPSSPALDLTYGTKDNLDQTVKCNFPGAVVKLDVEDAAARFGEVLGRVVIVAFVVAAVLW